MQSAFINNKHGSLVYEKHFVDTHLTSNDTIILASTFHGLSNIARELSPVLVRKKRLLGSLEEGGIDVVECSQFTLICLETLTGLRFFVVTRGDLGEAKALLRSLYELYSDYILKNPFYEPDMPVRCPIFEREVNAAIDVIRGNTGR